MAPSLEDHERRIAALEKAAERDQSIERAVADIVLASERRISARMEASERRMVDVLNERFDEVMTVLDRPKPRRPATKKKGGKR